MNALSKLLAQGGDVNATDAEGRTALICAVVEGKESIVEFLLKNQCLVDLQDNCGFSALHFAAQDYRIAIARLLLDAGAAVDLQDSYGNTPLWRATFESRGRGEMIELLLARGADRNLKNLNGKSPVDLAKTMSNFNIQQFFH